KKSKHGGLVVSTFASHLQGWGFDSRLRRVCGVCMLFPVPRGFPPGTPVSSPRAKDMRGRLIGISKLSVECDCVRQAGPRVLSCSKMTQSGSVVKPKTKRSKRFLQNREPKVSENCKNTMIMKGGNTSQSVTQALKDIYALKKPNAVLYKKKNIMRPFEDSTSLEFFSKKSDCSLFLFGSHNKKRPNNLIFGRLFDFHVLDMFELGIEKFTSLKEVKIKLACIMNRITVSVQRGRSPCWCLQVNPFETDKEYIRLRSVLTDFFRGPSVSAVRLAGLDHVLHFTALDGKVYLRSYRVLLKKSGCRTPRIELEEMGPSLDLAVRRTHLASDDLYRTALRQPKGVKPKKKKNISHDAFGTRYGRLHMQKQDLSKLQTRKMKGLRKRKGDVAAETGETTSPKKSKAQE
ncbi:hypothetical protein QTP86_034195, partial [Hemibagrus guttatus]